MRKSLVKTLAVTMAASYVVPDWYQAAGQVRIPRRRIHRLRHREQVTAKQRTRAMSLRCLALEAALIIFLSTLRSRKAGLRKKDWILRRCCSPTARYRWNLFHLTAGISLHRRGRRVCRRLGYDALVLGSSNTDDGTQYVFARMIQIS